MNEQPIEPTPEDIDRALDRVLRSAYFARAEQTSELLRYLVKLRSDRGAKRVTTSELKEHFAQANDSGSEFVRMMMVRLRDRLEQYNQQPEASSQWRFEIARSEVAGRGYRVEFLAPEQKPESPKKHSIRELRERRGWTLQNLAERALISTRTLQKVEKGLKTRPSTLHAIANALGVSYDELIVKSIPGTKPQAGVRAEPDFEIRFDPTFDPSEVKDLLTALADYYRACGGAGLELDLEQQEASVRKPVHV